MKLCHNCIKEIPEDALLCPYCGKKIKSSKEKQNDIEKYGKDFTTKLNNESHHHIRIFSLLVVIINTPLLFWGMIQLIIEKVYGYAFLVFLIILLWIYYGYILIKNITNYHEQGPIASYFQNFKRNWKNKSISIKIIEVTFWLMILLVILIITMPLWSWIFK